MTSLTKKILTVFSAGLLAVCLALGLFFALPKTSVTAFAAETASEKQLVLKEANYVVTEGKLTGLDLTNLTEEESKKDFVLEIPSTVTAIEAGTNASIFGDTIKKVVSIKIPSTVTAIGDFAFYGCTSLTVLDLSGATSLKTIGANAFNTGATGSGRADGVKQLTIPEGVTTIGNLAFANHTGITEIDFLANACGDVAATSNNPFHKVGYYGKGVILNLGAEGKVVNKIPANLFYSEAQYQHKLTTVNFVNVDTSVAEEQSTNFGANAFRTSTSLANVNFENVNIPVIGSYAFANSKISTLTLPSTVQTIGDNAFNGSSVATVALTNTTALKTIGASAFHGSALTSFNIPESVEAIGNNAFNGCKSLTAVTFASVDNSKLTQIGDSAFANTSIGIIIIPKKVNKLGKNAYANCTAVTEIRYFATKLESVTWTESPFLGAGTAKAAGIIVTLGSDSAKVEQLQTNLFQSKASNPINITAVNFKNVTIDTSDPEANTAFGNSVFERLTNLKKVEFDPACEIKTIGAKAFLDCISLNKIVLPATVKNINTEAFHGCTTLHSVNLEEVTYIGERAFQDCASLYSVNLNGIQIENVKNNAFAGCSRLLEIIYPASINDTTKTNIGLNSNVKVVTSSSIVEETGFVYENSDKETLISYVGESDNITLLNSVKTVSDRAFAGNTQITKVDLANVTAIGNYAFSGCTALDNVTIPANATLGEHAFDGCTALTTVKFAEDSNISNISDYAFYGCTALTSINLPASVINIKMFAFSGCRSLSGVTFNGERLESIGSYAFEGCANLKFIEIPKNVKTIGSYAFDGCVSLSTVYLPTALDAYTSNSFRSCAADIIFIAPNSTAYDNFFNSLWDSSLKSKLTYIVEVTLNYTKLDETTPVNIKIKKLYNMDGSYEMNAADKTWAVTGSMPTQTDYDTSVWYSTNEFNTSNIVALEAFTQLLKSKEPITLYAQTIKKPTIGAQEVQYKENSGYEFSNVLSGLNLDNFDIKISSYSLVNGTPSEATEIKNAGTYILEINLKDSINAGKWAEPYLVKVTVSPIPVTPTSALVWTLKDGGDLSYNDLTTIYIYSEGDNNDVPYTKPKKENDNDATAKQVINSYITYSGIAANVVLSANSDNVNILVDEATYTTTRSGKTVDVAKDAGVYVTSVQITMDNNYRFTVQHNENIAAYGLEFSQLSIDRYEIRKTWYIVKTSSNTLLDASGANFAVNGWTYNDVTGIPNAPTLAKDNGDPEELITFSLHRYNDTMTGFDQVVEGSNIVKWKLTEFSRVINAAMPAGTYQLVIFVEDLMEGNTVKVPGNGEAGESFVFTVKSADPLELLKAIDIAAGVKPEDAGGSIYGTLQQNGAPWTMNYTGSPVFVNAKDNVRVLQLEEEQVHKNRANANSGDNIWTGARFDGYYTKFEITYNVVNTTTGAGLSDSTFRKEDDFKADSQFVTPTDPGIYEVYFNISAPSYMLGSENRVSSYRMIIRNLLQVPTISPVNYSGESVRFDVPNSPFYKVVYLNGNDSDAGLALGYNNNVSDDYKNAGTHVLFLMINENYADYCDWATGGIGSGSKKFVKVEVEIAPAENASTQPLFLNSWTWGKYNSTINAPSWATKFGTKDSYTFVLELIEDNTVRYTYNGVEGKDFADADAGKYRLIATAGSGVGWSAFEEVIEVTIHKAEITWDNNKIPYIQSWYYGDFKTTYKTPEYALSEGFESLSELITTRVSLADGTGTVYDDVFAIADANGGEVPAGNYVLRFEIAETNNFDAWSYPVFFDVLKAQNYWDVTPNVPSWVFGDYSSDKREIAAAAIPHFGSEDNVVLTYYLVDETGQFSSQPYHSLKEMVDPITGEINVGKYVLIASMTGTDNFSDMHDTRIPFEVSPAQNSWLEIPSIVSWSESHYAGGANYPTSKPQFGVVVYTIIDSEGNEYNISELGNLAVGSYSIKAYVAGNENYEEMTAYATFAVFEDSVGMTGLIAATAVFAVIAVGLAVGGIVLLLRRNKKIEQEFRKMVRSELKRR